MKRRNGETGKRIPVSPLRARGALMEVRMLDFVEGARRASGTVVIIDVFRAFSTACYAFANGASSVIAVGEVNEARKLKSNNPEWVLMGERGGKKLEGFDHNNSPSEIESVDLQGKTVVLTTHAGTQGLANATSSDRLLTGSFVNARTTVQNILSKDPSRVSLVRMGVEATRRANEDDLCSEYLKSLLLELPFDINKIRPTLRKAPSSARFFDDNKPWSPKRDFDLCLDVDRFDFAIQVHTRGDGFARLEKVPWVYQ
jgi:2-phosphosulfolactate phosphatase